MKRVLVSICAFFLCVALVSCAEKSIELNSLGDGTYEGDNGVVYRYAPVGYEPTEQGKECGLLCGTLEETLYAVGELSTDEWMTTEYNGAATTVYYSADIELPTLSTLEPTLCYICEEDENIYSVYTLGSPENKKVDEEREVIEKIIDMLCDETVENEIWPRAQTKEVYDLKLYSEDWPAIYYNIEYSREGTSNYVYDRVSKRCVNVGDILEGYFEK